MSMLDGSSEENNIVKALVFDCSAEILIGKVTVNDSLLKKMIAKTVAEEVLFK